MADIFLTRECEATVIPAGDKVKLPSGIKVVITHRLGGNFTVVCDWGMFRIQGLDADALGLEIPVEKQDSLDNAGSHQGPPDQAKIWEALRRVFDPEIPVNIVDLGLVYSMDVTEPEPARFWVDVAMTLTSPGCGMGPSIAADAREQVMKIPGVADAAVTIVWDPPWTQDMISEEGKMELGMI